MAELELVGTLNGGTVGPTLGAKLTSYGDAVRDTVRATLDNAGGDIALKLRYSGLFRFRTITDVDTGSGNVTVQCQVRIGAIDVDDVAGEHPGLSAIIGAMNSAISAVPLPAGWSLTSGVVRIRATS